MEAIARRRAQVREKFEKQSLDDAKKQPTADINGNKTSILSSKSRSSNQKMTTTSTNKSDKNELQDCSRTKPETKSTALGQGRPQSFEARMLERRREREKDQRKKNQEQQNNRNAFKQKLDQNAPKGEKCALKRADSNIDRLLRFVQKRVNTYPGVNVVDYSSSWADGMAFCALMHVFVPDKISVKDLHPSERRKNFEMAFKVATAEGVPELLDVEDMVRIAVPDHRSVLTYVHTIYKVMVLDKEKEKADKEKAEKEKS